MDQTGQKRVEMWNAGGRDRCLGFLQKKPKETFPNLFTMYWAPSPNHFVQNDTVGAVIQLYCHSAVGRQYCKQKKVDWANCILQIIIRESDWLIWHMTKTWQKRSKHMCIWAYIKREESSWKDLTANAFISTFTSGKLHRFTNSGDDKNICMVHLKWCVSSNFSLLF